MSNAPTEHDLPSPGFPTARPRRLRYNPLVRELVRETELSSRDLILPLFVRPGKGVRQEISSMPGNYQLSVDTLIDEVGASRELGIKAFILFGIPEYKDATGSSISNPRASSSNPSARFGKHAAPTTGMVWQVSRSR